MAIATDSTRWYRGPAQVTFNSIDLGDMKEGSMVEVNITEGRAEHKADQFGSTPVREYGIGHGIEVTVELMEWDFAALSAALFGTSYATGAKEFTYTAGFKDLTASAAQLVITPLDATGHPNKKVTVFKAIPRIDGPIGYGAGGEAVIKVRFKGIVDVSTGNQIYKIGIDNS